MFLKNIFHYRKGIISLLFSCFLFSCSEQKPGYLLTEEKMVPVLKDMQIAYAGIDLTVMGEKNREKKYAEMNALILDKFSMNPDTFFKSYKYYQERPELLDEIYMRVIEQINLDIIPLEEKFQKPKERVPEQN